MLAGAPHLPGKIVLKISGVRSASESDENCSRRLPGSPAKLQQLIHLVFRGISLARVDLNLQVFAVLVFHLQRSTVGGH